MNVIVKITKQVNANYYHKDINDTIQVPLTTYIAGVVGNEIGNAHIEACKAQAIAARTTAYPYFTKNKAVSDTGASVQAFSGERASNPSYANAIKAAQETEGLILTYNGVPCSPCSFSANNGGRTTSSKERWGGYRAWLIQQDDPWDVGNKTGHGVGMSQRGAKAMAAAGKTYKEILAFYYPGTKIESMDKKEQNTVQSTTEVNKMSTITIQQFVQAAEYINKNYKVQYKLGASGSKSGSVYLSDCRGYAIIWCLKRCGLSVSCPGTNYSIRNQMRTLHKVSSAKDVQVGEVVYKVNKPGDSGYSLYAKYKKGGYMYNADIGELNSYHIGVVVQTSPSLIIRHCTSGGIKTDTKIGSWNYAGFLKYVEGGEPIVEQPIVTQPQIFPITEQVPSVMHVTGPKKLNLRKSTSTNSSRILQIPAGGEVTILQAKCNVDGWFKVKYKTYTGYVMSQYLS